MCPGLGRSMASERFISVVTMMLFRRRVRDQFRPHVEGANLFGRGSSDMKSGLAAMIHAAAAVRDEGLLRNGRIGIVVVPDEETAGARGLAPSGSTRAAGERRIGMLTPEPTGGVIWNANRGAISLRATCAGKQRTSGGNSKVLTRLNAPCRQWRGLWSSRRKWSFAKRNTILLLQRRENPF